MDFSEVDPRLMGSGTGAWADETNDTNSIAMPYQATSPNQSAAANANFARLSDDAFTRARYDGPASQDNVDEHYGFNTFHDLSTPSINQANSASFSSLAPGYTAMSAEPSSYSTNTSTPLPEIPGICLLGRASDSLSPPATTRVSPASGVLPAQPPQTRQHSAHMDTPMHDTYNGTTLRHDAQASINSTKHFPSVHPMTNATDIPNDYTYSCRTPVSTVTHTDMSTPHRTINMHDSKTGRYKGYIKSEAEAEDLFKQYLAQCDTDEGSPEGFPRDSAGQCRLVHQAVDAMVQLKGSREAAEAEKAESSAKRRLTAYNRVLEHFWSDLELELMGWRLLCEKFDTFMERWNEVLNQLRVSKRTVKALFDTPFVARLARNVTTEGKRIEANQKGNAKKGKILRERTQAERAGENQLHR
ncbi:hypothetical protein DL768_009177 [Monosporascus sp. mg162]|nr:hypothetical protein DL768_009177 [Monosporascus sp. mg162]